MNEEAMPVHPCARAEELLPEYWQGELNAAGRAALERHLETCADCAELAAFWGELDQLPEAKPDPFERRRFDAMLSRYQTERRPWREVWAALVRTWLRPLPVALALVLVLAGFGGGWWLSGSRRPFPQDRAGEIAALQVSTLKISALEEEVHATNKLVVLSMLRQQSANDRLAGVSYSRHLSQPDPQILQALLNSLKYDSSPDVRLAALDVLQSASGDQTGPEVTRGLVEAFPYQSSPLVEVALVDSLLELRPPAAQALLQKVSADPAYSPDVRQRAAWGLSHWNQNPS
jgi:HEAT repeats/Putative zinc-finger